MILVDEEAAYKSPSRHLDPSRRRRFLIIYYNTADGLCAFVYGRASSRECAAASNQPPDGIRLTTLAKTLIVIRMTACRKDTSRDVVIALVILLTFH